MNAALIVAHPDDETIWAGGLILGNPQWDWTVLSLCRADDADRAPKFRRVCERLGVTGLISDLDDSAELAPIDAAAEIGPRIAAHLPGGSWDLCVTHGANGEYGHRRHKEVHTAVLDLASQGRILCRDLWTFAYECDSTGEACRPAPWADVLVDLTPAQLAEKMHIVRDLYGYAEGSFEVKACVSPECFMRCWDSLGE
jgi:LmbE family N-acetylglucosaminyl deacetylase